MAPQKRKAGKRRLADMNAAEPERAWAPDLEPEWPPFEDTFPISEDARSVQKFSLDEYGRVAEWAVVQMRRDGDRWRRVAVYDICHGEGFTFICTTARKSSLLRPPYDRCRRTRTSMTAWTTRWSVWLSAGRRTSGGRIVATRAQLRARTVPAVARLARSRDFRSAFAKAGERQQTIISVLPDDTVGYVLDRLDEAGGSGVLVLLTDEVLRIASLAPASEARMVVAAEDDRATPVQQDSQVDMFFDYLERVGTAVVRRVAARLVDHGPLQRT